MKRLLTLLLMSLGASAEVEISGSAAIEQRLFWQDSFYQEPSDGQSSVYIESEFYGEWNDGLDSLLFKPFVRFDDKDSRRTHADIRELMWLHVGDDWELRTGIGKVFWGQTESQHLVDVINQTDFVEAIDGEDKLGQPMVNLQLIRDWGTTSLFVLPYFRERTFTGVDGRLRLPFDVDEDNAIYESGAEQKHTDLAARWSHTLGDWEVGVSYFNGTSREPVLVPALVNDDIKLQPWYLQMQQYGVDVLAVVDAWLIKFEGISRNTRIETFSAFTGGFEYTEVGVFDSVFDIGWLMEYQFDDRGKDSEAIGQNDLMLGSRIVFNDADGTEILLGVVQDLDRSQSRSGFIEGSARINDNLKWRIDAWLFSADEPADPLFLLQRDDYVQLSLEYYF